MNTSNDSLRQVAAAMDPVATERIEIAAERIVEAKQRGGKVVVVTGSGPNIHEGVTTLLAELLRVGLVDGVTTSSAVVSHEMGGTLDKVKRCAGMPLGLPADILPRGGEFELTLTEGETMAEMEELFPLDDDLLAKLGGARERRSSRPPAISVTRWAFGWSTSRTRSKALRARMDCRSRKSPGSGPTNAQ